MKKEIFGAVVVVAIAVGTMVNVNLNKVSNRGDLAMANVEALAQEETQVSFPTNTYGNNTASTCTCSTCVKDQQNVSTSSTPVVSNNSGVTGANGQYAGTGGGGTYSQGQTVTVVSTVNCGPCAGGCCDQSRNGVYINHYTS
jgi:hypothetical protein